MTIMNDDTSQRQPEPIAIIGMGCRLPGGANSPTAFWQLLCNEIDAITEIPVSRWSIQKFYDPDPTKPGQTHIKWGGFIDDFDHFDASFFGISPREAAVMDPQQRILLETAWEALEDGGQAPEELAGSATGVFVGVFMRDWEQLHCDALNRPLINNHTGTGSSMSIAANRLSYCFDLRGPSIALDTACSSSLVAVHLACQSLHSGECTLAIAGGVNLLFSPEKTIATSKATMLSPDGRCKSFDARANGYARSEGCGMILLKPLSAALADGDAIYAVIRGSATNQDGRSNGLTVPNGQAQEAALNAALRQADRQPNTIQYIEAHGTGTYVGDPIETTALGNVIGKRRATPCFIGSVKSNIGHLEGAAGVTGLMKTALALKHGQIPANLHFETPNPQIQFDLLNLQVPTAMTPWPNPDHGQRLAAVNSFGFGGTNATVILEEAPQTPTTQRTNEPTNQQTDQPADQQLPSLIFPISARTPEALRAAVQAHRDFAASTAHPLTDLCHSAAQRRGHHPERAAFIAATTEALVTEMDAFLLEEQRLTVVSGQIFERPIQLAFVYAGMGSQWPRMGQQLWATEPIFQQALQAVDHSFTQIAGWSIVETLLADDVETHIHQTAIAQPAIFAVQVGLTALWQSWGVTPTAIVGHSVGEIAAAHAAGALTLVDAVQVIYHRSRLQQTTAGQGTMLAVGLSAEEVMPYLAGQTEVVSIGAINSPNSVTLAGDADTLAEIAERLAMAQVFNRFLKVEVPYHSPQMEPLRAELLSALAQLQPAPVTIPLYSTVTGELIDGATLDAAYWWRNIRQPVCFAQAIDQMQRTGATHFLEVSPHPVLGRSIQDTLQQIGSEDDKSLRILSSLRREQPEQEILLSTMGQLYTQGYAVDWTKLVGGTFVRLPAYPWQRERYWFESAESRCDRVGGGNSKSSDQHPLLGKRFDLALSTQVWENELTARQLPYLNDHRVQQMAIFPGAGYVEMALAAIAQQGAPQQLNDIAFQRALPLPDIDLASGVHTDGEMQSGTRVQLTLTGDTISILSRRSASSPEDAAVESDPPWVHHAGSRYLPDATAAAEASQPLNVDAVQERLGAPLTQAVIYEQFETLGLSYGPTFQGISDLWHQQDEVLTKLHLHPEIVHSAGAYQLHPVLIDLCLQSFLGLLTNTPVDTPTGDDRRDTLLGTGNGAAPKRTMYLPVQIDQLKVLRHPDLTETLYCHAWLTEGELNGNQEQQIAGNIRLYRSNGELLLTVDGLRCQPIAARRERVQTPSQYGATTYEVKWQLTGPSVEKEAHWPGAATTNWLIFADSQGIAQKLAQELVELGQRPILVWPGERFEHCKQDQIRMRPGNAMDMAAIFTGLTGQTTHGVIHLWNLDSESTSPLDQELGCISILHLVQSLGQPTPRLWLVTQGARQVLGRGLAQPEQVQQATAWGLGRVIAQEHPGLHCVCLDLDPDAQPDNAAQQLLQELDPEKGSVQQIEDQVAWRADERYVARMLASPLEPTVELIANQPLRADVSYLITGGLGALGLQIAHSLLEQGARHLVLCGRRGAAGKEAALERLRIEGAVVQVLRADVSQGDDVANLLYTIAEQGPPLGGIIHAAGILDDGVLRQQTAERFANVLEPKIAGAWHLHEQTRALDLDFFICFSSVASLLGSPGQGNYAAANAYLDALAAHRHAQGLAAQSINWGPWAESGMAAKQKVQEHLAGLGMGSFTNEQGIDLFQNLLAATNQRLPQVGAVLIDWPTFYAQFPSAQAPFFSALTEGLSLNQERLLDRLVDVPQSEWRDHVGDFLRTQLAQVLGYTNPVKISLRQRLVDLGLDSVMVVELQNRLESGLHVELATALIFEYQTVDALLNYLMEQMMDPEDDAPQEAEVTWSQMETELEAAEGTPATAMIDDAAEQLLAKLDSLSAEELAALLSEEFETDADMVSQQSFVPHPSLDGGDKPLLEVNSKDSNEYVPEGTLSGQVNGNSLTAATVGNGSAPTPPTDTHNNYNADATGVAPFDERSLQPPYIAEIVERVYANLAGRHLPMDEQVAHRAPLDADPVTPEGRHYQQRYGIPSGAAILNFHHINDALPHFRHIYLRYVGGFHAGLDTQDPEQMWRRVQKVEDEFRDFAVEGVGAAYTILDAELTGDRLTRWQSGPAHAYFGTINIGIGIALASLKQSVEAYIANLDSVLRWKIVDGYGFTFGHFNWETGVEQLHFPAYLSDEARHVYYQGLGRSLWIACCGEAQTIARLIARFPQAYQGDLWSGAAFASTMMGGVSKAGLEQVRVFGHDHLPAIAQGAAFAVNMRGSASVLLPRQELACQVYWRLSAHDVAAIAQETLQHAEERHQHERSGAYEGWRTHIQQIFTEREATPDKSYAKSTG